MNSGQFGLILRRLREAASPSAGTDAELLTRYGQGEQAAFAGLVARYSGLVWGVARRILRRQQDGEDVFQATFLALSRKSSSFKGEYCLAPWLYTVAVRLALTIKRRQKQERFLMEMAEPTTFADPSAQVSGRELARAFDEEMQRLPETYREALVLCCLEGLSRDEAAGLAGCTLCVMKNRRERGRKLLRKRLERRGIAVPATLLLVGLASRIAPPAVCAAACRVFETASPGVAALAGEAIESSMMMKTIILTVALGLMAASIGIGGSVLADPEPTPKTPPAVLAQAKQLAKEAPVKEMTLRLDRFGDPLPDEAIVRFGTVRFRQGYLVSAIRYSPDEKTIAIAGYGRSVGLWDVATGKELLQFDDGSEGLSYSYSIAFSPDGKMLAATNRDKVQLWNTRSGELIREFRQHVYPRSLAFSSDGKMVISGDSTIRFWDVATGQELAKFDEHADTGPRSVLALSSDGKLLASAGADKIIRVWNVETRRLLKELRGAHLNPRSLSFSPDGKMLVSAGYGEPSIIWDVTKGEPVHKMDEEHKGVRTAAFSPNGKWVATGCKDGSIRLYDPLTGKESRRWETQSLSVQELVFSKNSKIIATNSTWECGVRFWDVETGDDTRPHNVHRSSIDAVQLSPDGKSVWGLGRADQRVIRWNAATAEPVEVVPIPAIGFLWEMGAISPGGALLAWGSASDKTIHLMDLKTREDACEPLRIETRTFGKAIFVQFSPDGRVLAVGCDGGLLYIWKWQTERKPQPLKAPDGDQIRPRSFTPDGKHLVTGSFERKSDKLHVWDVATGRTILSFAGNKTDNALAVSPDGKWLVSLADSHDPLVGGHIHVIDFQTGKTAREIKVDPHGGNTLAFSADGSVLAFDREYWNALAPQERRRSDVKLIEFATGETIATFNGHHSGVLDLRFTADRRTLYSGGSDSTILKWDATARHGKGPSTPNPAAAWEALAQEASKAYPARWDLVDSPKEAVALLRKKILPAKKLDARELRDMVESLDSANFQDRQKASALLKSLGYSIEPLIRRMVEAEKRPEVKQRLQTLIDELSGVSFLRIQRAMQVLEAIGSEDAKQLIRELADGAPESMLTREAATVLKRMGRKDQKIRRVGIQ